MEYWEVATIVITTMVIIEYSVAYVLLYKGW